MVRRLVYLGLAAGVVGAVACADALRLEPPAGGAGGDTTTGPGGTGGGGGAPVPCVSNSDCPAPTVVCDTIKGICVQCLELSDCGHMPGTLCDQGECQCPGEDSWCAPDLCVDQMTSPEHCGGCGFNCFGACSMGSCADPWVPVAADGAPSARARHAAVWTGSQMFVWGGTTDGGTASNLADGGLYDPLTREWTAIGLVGAPTARERHSAVLAGDKVIVWGGQDGTTFLSDGAVFDPASNSWTPMSSVNAPAARVFHTAVWTGSEMIVFGGQDENGEQLSTGGRYDLANDSWTATASVPAPGETRMRHTAVWDGSHMLVYGGLGDVGVNTNVFLPSAGAPGARSYDPVNGWLDVSTINEPSARDRHTAVWDGSRMLIFGGTDGTELATGHKLEADTWAAFTGPAPEARREHTAVWLEDPARMVVWGGIAGGLPLGSGAVFVSATSTWDEATPTALAPRYSHSAVATSDAMIVWGGFDANTLPLGDGGIYTP